MKVEQGGLLPAADPILEPIVEVVENLQEPFHVQIPDGPVRVVEIRNDSDRALVIHLPGGMTVRNVEHSTNVLDGEFIRRAVKMADVPRDLRTCFDCGRFVPKHKWQLDLSRKRLPICDNCNEYSDYLP